MTGDQGSGGTERNQNMNVWQGVWQTPCGRFSVGLKAVYRKGLGELAEWLRSGLQIRKRPPEITQHSVRRGPRTYREPIVNVWQCLGWGAA